MVDEMLMMVLAAAVGFTVLTLVATIFEWGKR